MIKLHRHHRKTVSYPQPSKLSVKAPRKTTMSNRKNSSFVSHSPQRDLDLIYSDLAKKSLKKTYDLNNLRPYSTQTSYFQLYQQLNSINESNNIPQTTKKSKQKDSNISLVIQKLKNLPISTKRRLKTTQQSSFKQKLIQTQMQDEEGELTENFISNLKNDRKKKKKIRENIQNIFYKDKISCFPNNISNLVDCIKILQNKNKTTQQYNQQQFDYDKTIKHIKESKKGYNYHFNKNDLGIFCVTRNKGYYQQLDSQRQYKGKFNRKISLDITQKPLKLYSKFNNPKIYYHKYLRKYSDRKQLILCGNFNQKH